jgi:predicted ester cyclase
MTQPSPEHIALEYYDLFNRRLLQQAELLVSPQAVFHYPHTKEHMIGRAGYRELARTWVTAFPDARVDVQGLTAEGPGRVRVELLGHGTHTGPLTFGGALTLEPSGRRAELPLTDTLEVSGGLIVNSWLSFDVAELLRRLT